MQNCRGIFGSDGEFRPFHDDRDDGLATLAWIAEQPWFSDAVAMNGLSYLGYVQLAAGPDAPGFLKALVPQNAASRIYGVQRSDPLQLAAALTWLYLTYAWHFQQSALAKTRAALQRAQALRKAFAHLAVGDADRLTVGRTILFFQDVLRYDCPQDEFWAAMDHSKRVPEITAPVHLVGGRYDFFLPDQLADYRALRDAGRNRLPDHWAVNTHRTWCRRRASTPKPGLV